MVAAAQNREVDLQEDRQAEKQSELAAAAAAAGQTMVIRPLAPVLFIFAVLTRGTTRRSEQHRPHPTRGKSWSRRGAFCRRQRNTPRMHSLSLSALVAEIRGHQREARAQCVSAGGIRGGEVRAVELRRPLQR